MFNGFYGIIAACIFAPVMIVSGIAVAAVVIEKLKEIHRYK